eukprot:TRINITY_DN12543_c0_g1_i11.p3 TRINITY_DN12543_c0_g1~~TRINITY_DN12543_c0_g1_i11.p3  ORF type:complete len:136 (+),score=29.70 TRINITY_DN12543_c0_g1_i11:799-1206(+)
MVYLVDTPNYLELHISRQSSVEEVIKQVMRKYPGTKLGSEKPLEFPDNPNAYELRLLEDDSEDYYLPIYEIAALNRNKKIGEFDIDMIAFCQVRRRQSKGILQTITHGTPRLHPLEESNYNQLKSMAANKGVTLA